MKRSLWMLVGATLLVALLGTGVAVAQEEEEKEAKKWTNKTEFGLTSTSGNSDANNFLLGNEYKHKWPKAELAFDLKAIKNQSVVKTWSGANPDVGVIEETTATTAETYLLGLAYRRDVSGRLFWYARGNWFRNEPAGLADRYRAGAGIGYTFVQSKRHALNGQLGATYSDDTKTAPGGGEESVTYSSVTALLDYAFKISETAELTSVADGFIDPSESNNWQANWVTSLTASMTSRLALKLSYAIVYDNAPSWIEIPPGFGAQVGGNKVIRAGTTDRFLTASLVLNF